MSSLEPDKRQKISSIRLERLQRVYNWPRDDEDGDDNEDDSSCRHVTHFSLKRKADGELHRIRDIKDYNVDRYILTATLLPRPGQEHEGVANVEIDTIGGYSIDFGDSDTHIDRGVWLRDSRESSHTYYHLMEPAAEEYQALYKQTMYDNSMLFRFHDVLLGTDMVTSNEIDEADLPEVIAEGKYAKLVFDGGSLPRWHIKSNLTIAKLCEQEPSLDAQWIQDRDNAHYFWNHSKECMNFDKCKDFNKSLQDIRSGKKTSTAKKMKSSSAYIHDSEDDSDDAESDDSREVGKKHAKSRDKASKKSFSNAEASRPQKSLQRIITSNITSTKSSSSSSSNISSMPATSDSCSIKNEAPLATGSGMTFAKKTTQDTDFAAPRVVAKKPAAHVPSYPTFLSISKLISLHRNQPSASATTSLQLQQQAALEAAEKERQAKHSKNLESLSRLQASEEEELQRRRKNYQKQNRQDRWINFDSGTSDSSNPSDDNKLLDAPVKRVNLRIVPFNQFETNLKWEQGCEIYCCCLDLGSHPQRGTLDIHSHAEIPIVPIPPENFTCFNLQGNDEIPREPKDETTRTIKWWVDPNGPITENKVTEHEANATKQTKSKKNEHSHVTAIHEIDTSDNWTVEAPWHSRGQST